MNQRRTFTALDGVRGVAALAVMLFHTGAWPAVGRLFPSAYLAVDLFFALSGFVVAHAYGARMRNGMGAGEFVRARVVRLWPLFALGMSLGLVAVVIHGLRFGGLEPWPMLRSLALQIGFLPDITTAAVDGRMFPMNGPAWSLFFELAVNIAFALLVLRLSLRNLVLVLPMLAAALALTASHYHGLDAGHRWDSAFGGVVRVTFSFAAGLALHGLWRSGRLPTLGRAARPVGAASGLALVVLMSIDPGPAWRPLFDWSVTVLAWPALMAVWIGLRPSGLVGQGAEVLGRLSYPAYVLHGPAFAVALNLASIAGMGLKPIPPAFWIAAIAAVVVLSWLADRYFDGPVRGWLNARLARAPRRPEVDAAGWTRA